MMKMSEGLWSIIGVIVGFGFAELIQVGKSMHSDRTLRKSLKAELASIVRMIPSKVHVLSQAEECLKSSRLMCTTSTHFPHQVYGRVIETAPHLLVESERDCLHVLYERLRINDSVMDGIEERFNIMAASHSIEFAVQATSGALNDLKAGLKISRDVAESFIRGQAIDVYPPRKDS